MKNITSPQMTNNEIIDTLKSLVFGSFDRTTSKEREALNMAIEALEEQKKGKWEFEGYNMFACSHCGAIYTTEQLNNLRNYDSDPYLPFYCPKCGADMRYEVGYDE